MAQEKEMTGTEFLLNAQVTKEEQDRNWLSLMEDARERVREMYRRLPSGMFEARIMAKFYGVHNLISNN